MRIKSFFFAITIGTIITSGGIGKNELSIKDSKLKWFYIYDLPTIHFIVYYFIIFLLRIKLIQNIMFVKILILKLWANGGTGRRAGLKFQW